MLELFSKWLEKTVLFEMAYSRKTAYSLVSGTARPLSQHILKVLIMPNSLHINHWKDEIYSYLINLRDIILKPQNRRLDFETYWNWLYLEPEINVILITQDLILMYKNEKPITNVNLQQKFADIMKLICQILAENKSFKELEMSLTLESNCYGKYP